LVELALELRLGGPQGKRIKMFTRKGDRLGRKGTVEGAQNIW
jgi:hypothetical protein